MDDRLRAQQEKASSLRCGNLCVAKTPCLDANLCETDHSFLWVISGNSQDPLTENARHGIMTVDMKMARLLKGTGTFVDIGANIGCISFFLISQGWSGYAFEAADYNAQTLRKTSMLNDFPLQVNQVAVSSQSGTISFAADGPWGMVQNDVMDDLAYESIPCVSIDDWVRDRKIPQVDFVKIDIEGSEVAALRGMQKFLEAHDNPPMLVEMNAYALCMQGETQHSLLKLTRDYGYTPYEIVDGALYEYDSERLPEQFLTDFLFLGKNHKNIALPIFPIRTRMDHEATCIQVIDQLEKYRQWNLPRYGREQTELDYGAYICYALKDYPQISQNDKVSALLLQIRKERWEEPFIQKALAWYKQA